MAGTNLYLGLDVGGTKCAVVIGDDKGTIRERIEWPSQAERGPQPMIADLTTNAGYLREKHAGVQAVGVSIGGPLDARNGIIHAPPNLPGWDAIPLRQILEEQFKLPVFIEHDAAACALAEYRWGAGVGAERLVYLTCATGFGAGYVFDGKAYYGAQGRSGEIGHTRYAVDGPEAFGKTGSAEAFCSAKGLSRLAAWKFPHRWEHAVPSPPEIARLARDGDADAREVITINARAVGEICSRIADMLFPDVIILGSLSQYLGESWLNEVHATFIHETLPTASRNCRLAPPGLGKRLQDCSALVAAMRGV
ncbi:MAG: ROK family protein [Phycisphaeraceae bacterium]|nr:ROK family protein [Phycisphaeraceae bacterium]